MDKDPIAVVLQILFVIGFIVLPPILKALKKSNANKQLSTNTGKKSFTPSKPARSTIKKSTAIPRREQVKNVDDILADIFDNKITTPKKEKRKPARNLMHSNIKPQKDELPVFKTNISNFEVDKPKLRNDIKEFKPHIITSTKATQSIPPILKKLRKLNKNDLKYGIILSEVLGPPTSLK